MRIFQLPLLAAPLFSTLAGCTTLTAPLPGAHDPEIRAAAGAAEAQVRGLVFGLADGAAPDFGAALAALDVARVTVATASVLAGPEIGLAAQAERAALGVTLTVCAEGVKRMAAAPKAAAAYARGTFSFTCVVPLGVFAAR
jgi:hypothetical protein